MKLCGLCRFPSDVFPSAYYPLEQYCSVGFSTMTEMFCVYAVQYNSHQPSKATDCLEYC